MGGKSKRRRARAAFTLVEMLTVIVIIGILASLITAAVIAARTRARIAAIVFEVNGMAEAINSYEAEYGPMPDFHDEDAVYVHLKNRFPRWRGSLNDIPNINAQSPASAIVFFLGGIPDANGQLTGFSANPRNPFARGGSRTPLLFEFDQRRLRSDGNGAVVYLPKTGDETSLAPYVYFRSVRGGYHNNQSYNAGDGGNVRPFVNVETDDWVEPNKFQIICAGLDGIFGSGQKYPNGEDYDEATFDNITNFAAGKLEDAMP